MGQQPKMGEQRTLGTSTDRKSIDIDQRSQPVGLEERLEILRLGIHRRPDHHLLKASGPDAIEQSVAAVGAALQIDAEGGSLL